MQCLSAKIRHLFSYSSSSKLPSDFFVDHESTTFIIVAADAKIDDAGPFNSTKAWSVVVTAAVSYAVIPARRYAVIPTGSYAATPGGGTSRLLGQLAKDVRPGREEGGPAEVLRVAAGVLPDKGLVDGAEYVPQTLTTLQYTHIRP